MPRHARLDSTGALHHIMVRGINKGALFKDDLDRTKFRLRLEACIVETKCSVYAWVLMDNHVHLLVKSGAKPVATLPRKLAPGMPSITTEDTTAWATFLRTGTKQSFVRKISSSLPWSALSILNPVRAGSVTQAKRTPYLSLVRPYRTCRKGAVRMDGHRLCAAPVCSNKEKSTKRLPAIRRGGILHGTRS